MDHQLTPRVGAASFRLSHGLLRLLERDLFIIYLQNTEHDAIKLLDSSVPRKSRKYTEMCKVNIIKYSRWFTRNNAFRGYFVYPFMERGRKLLQARALHHWIERASINRLILITQFSIFARKCTFFQSGSHMERLTFILYCCVEKVNTLELPITDLPKSGQSLYNGQTLWHGLNLA